VRAVGKAAKIVLGAAFVAGVAVGGYYAYKIVMAKKTVVDETVADVQSRLDELDPVSRAAAVAKLTADEAKSFKSSKA
jgi:hypothetical protein